MTVYINDASNAREELKAQFSYLKPQTINAIYLFHSYFFTLVYLTLRLGLPRIDKPVARHCCCCFRRMLIPQIKMGMHESDPH